MFQDIRYSLRALRNTPAFTGVAIVSMALGIGANTAIFSIVNAVMLKALPVTEPERLVQLGLARATGSDSGPFVNFTNPIWEEIRDRQKTFDGVFTFARAGFDESTGGQRRGLEGLWVSGQFFDALGVQPWIGRLLTPADDRRGGGPDGAVAVLGYPFWVARYAASPDVLGRTITLNGVPFTIVGVAPPGFFGVEVGSSFNVAVPFGTEPLVRGKDSALDRRNSWWLRIIGRLKPGHTPAQSQAELQGLLPGIREATMPPYNRAEDRRNYLKDPFTVTPAPTGTSSLRLRYRTSLFTLSAVVGLVLLIACANLANLLLARATARQKEFAVRLALGASRARLMRQLLVESLLIALAGSGIGLVVARWASALLVRQLTPTTQTTFPIALDLTLDWRVVGFTIAAAIVTAVLFGLAPAFRSTDLSAGALMKSSSQSIASGWSRFNTEKALISAQLALSLVLVFGAGLFVRSFTSLATLDPGFSRSGVLIVDVNLRRANYPEVQRRVVYDRLAEAQRATPGVLSVAATEITPIGGSTQGDRIEVPGFEAANEHDSEVHLNSIGPDYFTVMGISLHAGRTFDAHDTLQSPRVAIINQTFARKFFKGRNPIGQHYGRRHGKDNELRNVEIVGVVQDSKYETLREVTPPTAYMPFAQNEVADNVLTYVVRTAGNPKAFVPSLSDAIGRVRKDITYDFSTLAAQVDDSLIQERLLAELAGSFGALALLVAGVGLYGVMWLAMTRRRSEIGIRMALGAEPATVIRMVLREVALVAAVGFVAGGAVAIVMGRLVTTLLFGLTSTDASTWLLAIALLGGVATLASYLPARRASRVDPMVALREE